MNEAGKTSWQHESSECVLEWNGWQEYFKFWDGFVKEWFDCKGREKSQDALPDDSLTKCLKPLFDESDEKKRLSKDELPEPYCIDPSLVGIGDKFDPKKIGLVVVQMNPGAAQNKGEDGDDLEATKYYSNKGNDKGFLIHDFENLCGRKYSEWVERWSCFKTEYPQVGSVPPDASEVFGVPAHKVCGHDWWHNENRKGWFKSIAGCDLKQVFALETIPYHSKNFDIEKSFDDDEFKKYFLRRVLLSAGICAQSSSSKLVVCCGAKLRAFLGKLEGLKFASKIFTWEDKDKVELNVEEGRRELLEKCWPKKDKDGKYKKRWYELYRCEIPYLEQEERKVCKFLILSIYANSMNFPGIDFRGEGGVEDLLKERIVEAMADSSPKTLSKCEVNPFASSPAKAAEHRTESTNESRTKVNTGKVAFWKAFREWCQANGHKWCTADVAPRGDSYNPQGGGKCHLFFTIGDESGSIKGQGPLVTVGIYCVNGEEQRSRIKKECQQDFEKAFKDSPFDFQHWEFGKKEKKAKRILFVRRADWRNQTNDLFARMADDYGRIRRIMNNHGLMVQRNSL